MNGVPSPKSCRGFHTERSEEGARKLLISSYEFSEDTRRRLVTGEERTGKGIPLSLIINEHAWREMQLNGIKHKRGITYLLGRELSPMGKA